jgi:hypothetical protein
MESRLTRLEAVQTMLLEIGRLSSRCTNVTEFLEGVHTALGRIMYAANFLVALTDQGDGDKMVRFVYFVDEADSAPDRDTCFKLSSP